MEQEGKLELIKDEYYLSDSKGFSIANTIGLNVTYKLNKSSIETMLGKVDNLKNKIIVCSQQYALKQTKDFGYLTAIKLAHEARMYKVLELNKDRRFTEEDMAKSWDGGIEWCMNIDRVDNNPSFTRFIESISKEQTEWEVIYQVEWDLIKVELLPILDSDGFLQVKLKLLTNN